MQITTLNLAGQQTRMDLTLEEGEESAEGEELDKKDKNWLKEIKNANVVVLDFATSVIAYEYRYKYDNVYFLPSRDFIESAKLDDRLATEAAISSLAYALKPSPGINNAVDHASILRMLSHNSSNITKKLIELAKNPVGIPVVSFNSIFPDLSDKFNDLGFSVSPLSILFGYLVHPMSYIPEVSYDDYETQDEAIEDLMVNLNLDKEFSVSSDIQDTVRVDPDFIEEYYKNNGDIEVDCRALSGFITYLTCMACDPDYAFDKSASSGKISKWIPTDSSSLPIDTVSCYIDQVLKFLLHTWVYHATNNRWQIDGSYLLKDPELVNIWGENDKRYDLFCS